MPQVLVDRVTVRYPDANAKQVALDNVTLKLEPDQLVVALGPSGCGKTTLLNLLAGFLRPTQGRILFDGKPISGPSADRGVIFQDDALLPWLNVVDNIAFGLKLQGLEKHQRRARAAEALKQVHLDGFSEHMLWQLSGGMRQRVGLARALASDPAMLLLDEPFAALDAFTREQMQELLLQLWHQTNKQIFLITHDLEEAVFLASDLVLLSPRPGRIVERIKLDFCHRYTHGESARSIKSDPRFIALREHVLNLIFAQRESIPA